MEHLKSDEFVLVHDLFRQEISADSCLIVFAELLMNVKVHKRRFANAAAHGIESSLRRNTSACSNRQKS